MYKNFISISLLFFIFVGCATKEPYFSIEELTKLEQNPKNYISDELFLDKSLQFLISNEYKKTFFAPWHQYNMSHSKEAAMWAFSYKDRAVYGENHRLLTKQWFEELINNANFEEYDSKKQKAITISNSSLRALPTKSVLFYNPKSAGEGFPFDYNQNSAIYINTPLYVSHFSKDGLWAFVDSSVALGWIKMEDIAFVDDSLAEVFEKSPLFVNIKEHNIVKNEYFSHTDLKVGTLLPKIDENLAIVASYEDKSAKLVYIKDNSFIVPFPYGFDTQTIDQVSNEFLAEPYGWGGLYGHRDCSSMTRDFYAVFGIYLARNSASQRKNGSYLDLKELNRNQKKEFIITYAKPWKSLLYLKGHIMIYIGSVDGEPLVFHNIWGIRTINKDKSSGRFIVGQAVISDLLLGNQLNNVDKNRLLIDRVEGIVNLVDE